MYMVVNLSYHISSEYSEKNFSVERFPDNTILRL